MPIKGLMRIAALTLLPVLPASIPVAADTTSPDPRLEQSRDIVRQFRDRLKGELMAAVASDGMSGAIGVCSDVAPAIASSLSREHGARVRRTSTRVRNAANLPDRYERAVLTRFDERRDEPGEHFEVLDDDRARYLKAIPAEGLCLGCHGTEIPPAVIEKLDEKYPHDRARGYVEGDIRGAFSILWPATGDRDTGD